MLNNAQYGLNGKYIIKIVPILYIVAGNSYMEVSILFLITHNKVLKNS